MENEGYKPIDLKFPDDDSVAPQRPSGSAAAPEKSQVLSSATAPVVGRDKSPSVLSSKLKNIFGDPDADDWMGTTPKSEDKPTSEDHTFRKVIIGVVAAVIAVVGGAVAYEKACQGESDKPATAPGAASAPSTPKAPDVAPVVVEQPSFTAKCDFSSEPPGNLKWNCGAQVVDGSIKFEEGKSTTTNYGGAFTFTTVDGQKVDCEFTVKKPADRTKPQKLDSELLNCKVVRE